MIEISTKQIVDTWTTIIAEPDQETLEKFNIRDKGIITDLLRAKNEIWLGKPEVFDLRTLLPKGDSYQALLTSSFQFHDFVLLQFACSFRPASSCEFVRASVQIFMLNEMGQTDDIIAYDIFPHEVFMPVTYKRNLSISPDLMLSFAKVLQVETSAFEYQNAQEYVIYQPEITAFGKGTNEPGWDFSKSSGRAIQGIKDLFLVIKKPKSTIVKLRFNISNCKVRTDKIGIVPLPKVFFSDSKGTLIKEEYILI